MPIALVLALATSLGVHALALFVPDVDLSIAPEPAPLLAELRPVPKPQAPLEPALKPSPKPRPKAAAKTRVPHLAGDSPADFAAPAAPLSNATDALPAIPSLPVEALSPASADPPLSESHFPPKGAIRYRVDRGDQGFEVGYSLHDWEVVDGAYRLTSVTETSGLIALFKPLRIELESRGQISSEGFVPEHFVIRRKGRESGERVEFDWAQMQVRIGDGQAQPLTPGAQDLLSFHYQLAFTRHPETGSTMPIATGKKYGNYRIEALGDEELAIPAGSFRTLHLRVPGVDTTELWLAYDYSLLPVKIQHTDRKGDIFVQVATEIQLSKE